MSESGLVQLVPLLILVVLFWFLVLRPARKRQREFAALQQQLEVGSRVILASGIHGRVVTLTDDTAELEIASGTVITVVRQAIARVIDAEPGPAPSADEAAS